ncbi:hypothetical protein F5144DRAFT_362195 [Chaetomium tenue]|uniref:Uncharacterized protein n=1 Tax=Chaetomium tenue TaxID=1854479 RepID=A0ACB7NYQ4_9PEZI|nr:hypothetical protein F5144DRAFT_362195 [Chaetomium globosum]
MSSIAGQISARNTLAASGDTILTLNNPTAAASNSEVEPIASNSEPVSGDSKPGGNPSPSESPSAPPHPVTFRVSSQHLIQASPVFKAALTGHWKEGTVTENGSYEISAEEWDAEAMHMVLSLIHCRTKDTPRTISLDILVKIAVIVDYYQLHETLHFFTTLWIDALRPSVPAVTYSEDVMPWIFVSWVFKDAPIFATVTKLAIEESPGKLSTNTTLPIPEMVFRRINAKREGALLLLGMYLVGLKRNLLSGAIGCSFECRSLLLGALTKHMDDDGVSETGIIAAAKDRSLNAVVSRVKNMRSPSRDWHPLHASPRGSGSMSRTAGSRSTAPASVLGANNTVLRTAGSSFLSGSPTTNPHANGSSSFFDATGITSCEISLSSLMESYIQIGFQEISGLEFYDAEFLV